MKQQYSTSGSTIGDRGEWNPNPGPACKEKWGKYIVVLTMLMRAYVVELGSPVGGATRSVTEKIIGGGFGSKSLLECCRRSTFDEACKG